MGWEAWLTLAVVAGVFLALARGWSSPDIVFVGAVAFLTVAGVISPEAAFAGFANPGVLTVGVLFVVAAGLRDTGVLDYAGDRMLGGARSQRSALGRLAAAVIPLSSFMNNTPVVAMFIPVVLDWCRKHRVSPSKLLIPLSYLAILGGTCTLIGTSTNLVVHGMLLQHGLPGFGMFEIGWVGLPYAVIGFVYLLVASSRLLPDRKEMLEQLGESLREYLVEMQVQPSSRLVGQTVEGAGLRHLPGLFLIEIDRDGTVLGPVGPETVIEANDRLVFTGVVSSILTLEKIPGLEPVADPTYEVSARAQQQRRFCEAVISRSSPVVGKTIRDADFRTIYGAAVVAVHRDGARVAKKVGDIKLRAGDTLLLQVSPQFFRAYRNDRAFYLISDVQDWRPLRRDRAWIAGLLFMVPIALATFGLVPLLPAAALAGVLMIAVGCITAGEARRSVEWEVLIAIAAALGLGTALEESGAAGVLAQGLVDTVSIWGPVAVLAAIYLLTSMFTEVITNNAAAALLFPICLETARIMNVDSRPFLIALVLAASASFLTPIGYQTNMMVFGTGGYRFGDFARIGSPLNFVLFVVAVVLIPIIWPFAP
jgi:di/tricarboxylate transporter